ncbi:MAG: NUDIX hydrolase [Ruminococcaceae bacterium]|nr:NUDIX hydrolase [Oscillospiraceae bacterium]
MKSIVQETSSPLQTEEQFLASYRIEQYDRPSVATDVTVFSMFAKESDCHRKDSEPELSILLVKRGEHPFFNQWALPGGFLRADETVEACAIRETKEETNLSPVAMLPVGVFSEPNRDPRGRIISHAFAAIISEKEVKISGGSDTKDAKWFSVSFEESSDGCYTLTLSQEEATLTAELKESQNTFGKKTFEIITNNGLAFDHAKIIATALTELRKKADNSDLAFDFLPETFTLAALQKVQETLLGISLLTANFRRKVTPLLEETEEYTEGAGHRPARLFRRKQ